MKITISLCSLHLATGSLIFLAGCATTRMHTLQGEPPAPIAAWHIPEGPTASLHGPVGGPAIEEVETLSLADALKLALHMNPGLRAHLHQRRAADVIALHAGAFPNPEIEVELSEYDRNGAGFDSSESAITIGQPLELGQKRLWRKRLAASAAELAAWDYEIARLNVHAETSRRFTDVLVAHQRVVLARAAVTLIEQMTQVVSERVSAGTEPPVHVMKAKAGLELARLDAASAESQLASARRHLSAMWGSDRPHFKNVSGSLDEIPGSIPVLSTLQQRLATVPEIARWATELEACDIRLATERAARIPDIRASVGWQSFEEDGTDALAFGVGTSLPLFNRNHGNVAAALHARSIAEASLREAELGLSNQLSDAHARFAAAHQRVQTVRTKVVAAMRETYEAAREGYRQGKFGFLDMLDAQRGLLEAENDYVTALADFHAAANDVERITASPQPTTATDTTREENQ